jgi:hypothetical protein
MNGTIVAGWMLWSAFATAPPVQMPAPTVLGPKAFRDGDVIEITDVHATSPRLEQGETVTVRGRFRLNSQKEAHLALYLTQTEGDGMEEVDARQTMQAHGLRGEFELTTTIAHRGMLHVTYYDPESGKPFGGVYFGTREQMKEIADWDVREWYLRDSSHAAASAP